MIHHLSIPAENPEHVATVLAEIIGGKVTPLFAGHGTFAAWSKDEHGTTIEVFPFGHTLRPGEDGQPMQVDNESTIARYTETHAAISVELSATDLIAIAERERWQAAEHDRGPFRVVEFWLENRVLIEFFTPQMRADYSDAVSKFARS